MSILLNTGIFLIYSLIFTAAVFTGIKRPYSKAISVCTALFLFYLANAQALYRIHIFKVLVTAGVAAAACSIFGSSNHYVISLDIIFLFSILIPFFYYSLKTVKIFSAR